MRLRDLSLTIGLCASLLVHAIMIAGMLYGSARGVYVDGQRERPAQDATGIDVAFGDAEGRGEAANSFDGMELFQGKLGEQQQAFLSRDASGMGKIGNQPSEYLGPEGNGAPAASADDVAHVLQSAVEVRGVGLMTSEVATPVNKQSPDRAGAPVPAADPAPMSESESDAFSKTGSVEISAGRVDARLGRKVKTVRPRLSISGQYDLLGLNFPRMVLRVRVERTGKVGWVDVVKSSGSKTVDQEVEVAVYQWWIEPRPGVENDVVEIGVVWR